MADRIAYDIEGLVYKLKPTKETFEVFLNSKRYQDFLNSKEFQSLDIQQQTKFKDALTSYNKDEKNGKRGRGYDLCYQLQTKIMDRSGLTQTKKALEKYLQK